MCNTCYDRGYNDYPEYHGSTIEHKIEYIDGYKKKQYEILESDQEEDVTFCKKCFENGVRNSRVGIWAPPLTEKSGHFDSYEKGYYNPYETEAVSQESAPIHTSKIYAGFNQPENVAVHAVKSGGPRYKHKVCLLYTSPSPRDS